MVQLDESLPDCMLWQDFTPIASRPTSRGMARWPRHAWTTIFTYATVFVLFPILCWLAYAWVRGWLF
jgi:hypothetical protein